MNRVYHIYIVLMLALLSACVLNSCVSDLHDMDFEHVPAGEENESDVLDRVVTEGTEAGQ